MLFSGYYEYGINKEIFIKGKYKTSNEAINFIENKFSLGKESISFSKNGVKNYIKYCKMNNINKKYIDEKNNLDTPDVMNIFQDKEREK